MNMELPDKINIDAAKSEEYLIFSVTDRQKSPVIKTYPQNIIG